MTGTSLIGFCTSFRGWVSPDRVMLQYSNEHWNMSWVTTASMHLQTLRQAGLVRTRKEGTSVHYRLAGDDVAGLYADLRDVALAHLADADRALVAYLGGDDVGEAEDVPREELLRRARSGQTVVLDVRPRHEYAAGHIPGAVSIPVEELEQRLAELPADVQVVAYCRGAYCVLAY